ncbi:type II toxin-antitoxin system HicB family antitoxin [Candidatus Palauibacter sp.]|uniref:type II toxin-antitoxin system HicB family antitoxin n=1 Tax=Candidatus Palauibacter sp. TaxID=3101350 RepID=UPI003B01225F
MKSLEHYMTLPYTEYAACEKDCDGETIWSAWVEELPGCETHADTKEEALVELQDAKRVYLEGLLEHGVSPPLPSSSVWEVTVPDTPASIRIGHGTPEGPNISFTYPSAAPPLEEAVPA